jgi:hypothetical protein
MTFRAKIRLRDDIEPGMLQLRAYSCARVEVDILLNRTQCIQLFQFIEVQSPSKEWVSLRGKIDEFVAS